MRMSPEIQIGRAILDFYSITPPLHSDVLTYSHHTFCRGHTVKAVCESFQLSKDAGYKVVAHMMPDLPNVGMERDIEQFKEYFENPAFRYITTLFLSLYIY